MPTRLALTAPLAALTVALAGCPAPQASFPDLHPLTGTVTRDGKPVSGGGLLFMPDSGTWGGMVVNASVNPDGSFAAETSRTTGTGTVSKPGVPPGQYKVVFHPPSDGAQTGLESHIDELVTVVAGPNSAAILLPTAVPKGRGEPRDDANRTPK